MEKSINEMADERFAELWPDFKAKLANARVGTSVSDARGSDVRLHIRENNRSRAVLTCYTPDADAMVTVDRLSADNLLDLAAGMVSMAAEMRSESKGSKAA